MAKMKYMVPNKDCLSRIIDFSKTWNVPVKKVKTFGKPEKRWIVIEVTFDCNCSQDTFEQIFKEVFPYRHSYESIE